MTLALAAVLVLANGLKVAEFPEPGHSLGHVAVCIKLDRPDARETALSRILAEALLNGSKRFTRRSILMETARVGGNLTSSAMPDAIHLRASVPAQRLPVLVMQMASLVREPALEPDVLDRIIGDMPHERKRVWENAINDLQPDFGGIRATDVIRFARHVLRPSNVSIVVLGGFQPNAMVTSLKGHLEDWNPPKERYPSFKLADPPVRTTTAPGSVSTLSWEAKVEDLSAQKVAEAWLLAAALGAGKGAAVFQGWRIRTAETYQQTAFLWPSSEGIQIRVVAAKRKAGVEGFSQKGLDLLRQVVSEWNETDLERAKASILRPLPTFLDPAVLALTDVVPLSLRGEGLAALNAYWIAKTGSVFPMEDIRARVSSVSLEQLRAQGLEFVSKAKLHTLHGS